MLHMKLNAAVSFFSIAAAFSVFLLPSNAYGGICFLPDCNLGLPSYDDVNSDTKWCEDHGYYFRFIPRGVIGTKVILSARKSSGVKTKAMTKRKNIAGA